ncbi:MAG: hypothetical protein R6W92_03910 [Desulfocurvibacter africanus]
MQTFVAEKAMVPDSGFPERKKSAMRDVRDAPIDAPILDIVHGLCSFPWCYTLQSCFGHFVGDTQDDPHSLRTLSTASPSTSYLYRIAYVAVCLDECAAGRDLLARLRRIPDMDPDHVQFGCAEWFWERQVNSFVLQVQPRDRLHLDSMPVSHDEALRIQTARDRFFSSLRLLLSART